MPIINSDFTPAWWLRNSHLQTIWAKLFKPKANIDLITHRLELKDGDFLDIAMTQQINNKPIVLILHGMEGSLESHYAKPIIKLLDESGFAVCFMHFRSCSGELNRLERSYSCNDSADLQEVIEYIQNNYQRDAFAVIGYSLGGSVVLKWLSEYGNDAKTTTAIAISVPLSLFDSAKKLEKGFSRLYQRYLVQPCQQKYLLKQAKHTSSLNVDVKKLNTLYQFDDKVTAPLNGFKDADDYYTQCSSRQFLKAIKKPTLLIHSQDDPFMWRHTAPQKDDLSKDVTLELSKAGGHVGFISGNIPLKAEYWLDARIVQWLLQQKSKQ